MLGFGGGIFTLAGGRGSGFTPQYIVEGKWLLDENKLFLSLGDRHPLTRHARSSATCVLEIFAIHVQSHSAISNCRTTEGIVTS